jgi:hypothetical protein
MGENSYREDKEELRELLRQYENLRLGRQHSFLEEEAFERIIDYFDEKDELAKAMEAADIGIEQFPFSSVLMIRKRTSCLPVANIGKPWRYWKEQNFLTATI